MNTIVDHIEIRQEYCNHKLELFKKAEEQRTKLLHARLAAENANIELRDIESQLQALHDAYFKQLDNTPGAEPWHPASEKPERTDGWFLAVSKDGNPFLTHFIGAEKYWVNNVHMWQYVNLPI